MEIITLAFAFILITHASSGPLEDRTLYDQIISKCPNIKYIPEFKSQKFLKKCDSWLRISSTTTLDDDTRDDVLCLMYYNGITEYCNNKTIFTKEELLPPKKYNLNVVCENASQYKMPININCLSLCRSFVNEELAVDRCSLAYHFNNLTSEQNKVQSFKNPGFSVMQNSVSTKKKDIPFQIEPDEKKTKASSAATVKNNSVSSALDNKNVLITNLPSNNKPNSNISNNTPKTELLNSKAVANNKEPDNSLQDKNKVSSQKIVSHTPDVTGTLQTNVIGKVKPEVSGSLPPKVTGNLPPAVTGDLKPDITGNLPPAVTGDLKPDISGNPEPDITSINVTPNSKAQIQISQDQNEPVKTQGLPKPTADIYKNPKLDENLSVQVGGDELDKKNEETLDPEDNENQFEEENPEAEKGIITKPLIDEGEISYTSASIDGDSYFFSYFMVICIMVVMVYVGYHNRQKVLAIMLEGKKSRRPSRGRRPNSANYHKLDSNLEEAMSSSCHKSTSNVIY